MPRQTNEDIDKRILEADLPAKRVGEINGMTKPTAFQCMKEGCECIWYPTPDNLLRNKSRCPRCSGRERWTNERLDKELEGLSIKRLGDCNHGTVKIAFQCLACGYGKNGEWETQPNHIHEGHGCPKCAGNAPLTNEEMDYRLEGRSIKRIGNIDGAHTKIAFQCMICNHGENGEWLTSPDYLSCRGCPECADTRISNEDMDKRLVGRNLKRLGDMQGMNTPISFQCMIESCMYGKDYEWCPFPSDISAGGGCPKCMGSLPITNEEMDYRLEGRNIKRLGDMHGMHTPTAFQCMIEACYYGANGEWITSPTNICTGHGCPKCSLGKNQRIVFEALVEAELFFEAEKCINEIANADTRYHIDFYLPQHNSIIEYNGIQHYIPVERFGGEERYRTYQVPRDTFVRDFCNANDIRLIIIDGRKYTNLKLKDYLFNEIIPMIKMG